jgi:hypothetical protein
MKAAQHLYAATGFTRTPDLDFEPAPACILGGPGIPWSVPDLPRRVP